MNLEETHGPSNLTPTYFPTAFFGVFTEIISINKRNVTFKIVPRTMIKRKKKLNKKKQKKGKNHIY